MGWRDRYERRLTRAPSGLDVVVIREGDTGTVVLTGEFDLSGRSWFAEGVGQLVADGVEHIRVDAGNVIFIDSAALTAFLAAQATAEALGIGFEIRPASPGVRRLIELAGLSDLLLPED